MDPRIILAGRQPDLVNTLHRSNQAAQYSNEMRHQNALRQFNRDHGAAVAAGNQAALDQYAGIAGPEAALGVQGARQRMDILSAQEQRAIRAEASKMDAAQRSAELAKAKAAFPMAYQYAREGDLAGVNKILGDIGVPPLPSTDHFLGVAARFEGVLDVIEKMDDITAAPDPADEYGRYWAEEIAAGRVPLTRLEYAQAKKGAGFEVTTKDGTTIRYGGGRPDAGGGVQPDSPEAMLATIDGILGDPALDTATGMFSFLQHVPGTPQRRFGARAAQLEGQAFLQAFESLKGGGQITEIEGQKATQAIGRLDTAQSADDYRAALTELRDVLMVAAGRPVGWAEQKSSTPPEIPTIQTDEEFNALPSGTLFTAPDGTQRRKP